MEGLSVGSRQPEQRCTGIAASICGLADVVRGLAGLHGAAVRFIAVVHRRKAWKQGCCARPVPAVRPLLGRFFGMKQKSTKCDFGDMKRGLRRGLKCRLSPSRICVFGKTPGHEVGLRVTSATRSSSAPTSHFGCAALPRWPALLSMSGSPLRRPSTRRLAASRSARIPRPVVLALARLFPREPGREGWAILRSF